MLGACVSRDVATGICDPTERLELGACRPRVCASSDTLDLTSGLCVPQSRVDVASRLRLQPGEHARCPGRSAILLVANAAFCVPESVSAIRPTPDCAPGELFDAHADRCVAVLRADRAATRVDVAQWARIVLGTDGGYGSARLCRALQFVEGSSDYGARIEISVEISMQNNEPGNLVIRTRLALGDNPRGLGPGALQSVVETLVAPVRLMGGASNAASISLHFQCDLAGLPRPLPLRDGLAEGPNTAGL